MGMRDLIIKCVESAKGWQFVSSHQLVKIPGSTEPVGITRMTPAAKDALAAQLVSQIDESEHFSFTSTESGRAIVVNGNPKCDRPERSSFHGDGRTINTLKAIEASGFIK